MLSGCVTIGITPLNGWAVDSVPDAQASHPYMLVKKLFQRPLVPRVFFVLIIFFCFVLCLWNSKPIGNMRLLPNGPNGGVDPIKLGVLG
jgi:hypothetical protein